MIGKTRISNIVSFLLIVLLFSSCHSSRNAGNKQISDERSDIIKYASTLIGTRYRYGGTTAKGFDCSGYVNYVFNKFGYSFPRSSGEMARIGEKVSEKDVLPGDLIFFKGRRGSAVGHVGIVTERDSQGNIYFIHSATSSGVRIDSNQQSYYKSRYLQVRRVVKDKKQASLTYYYPADILSGWYDPQENSVQVIRVVI